MALGAAACARPVITIAPAALSVKLTRAEAHSRSYVLCTQAACVAVSGSFAYVTTHGVSNSLVVVDISNPASPVIRGSVVSSSLLYSVREARLASGAAACAHPVHEARVRGPRLLKLARALTRSSSRSVHTQAYGVAVRGSYAYVTATLSYSLVVVDVSNPTFPVIRGSVVSSTLLGGVREAGSCTRGWPLGRCGMRPPLP